MVLQPSKLFVSFTGVEDVLVFTCLLDDAGLDELGHEVHGLLPSLILVPELLNLLLQILNMLLLGQHICLLVCGQLLISLNLCLGALSFAAHLEHIGGYTFRNCRE